ncbi:MAG: S1 family peptidase [Solirubrobacterales bacterium]
MTRRIPIAVAAAALVALALVPSGAGAANGSRPRIVGGKPIPIAQAPWQVALAYSPSYRPGDAEQRQLCGGTLVAPTLVITAAHCVSNESGSFKPARQFSVISGRTTLSASDGLELPVESIWVPENTGDRPLYDPRRGSWDMVMLRLPSAAIGTPIKLAGPDEASLWAPGRPALVSGWGSVSQHPSYPDSLRGAEIGVMPDSFCRLIYGPNYDQQTSMCAGTFLGTRDTCYGDSGGPLVVPTASGEYRLIGDTSYGRRCGTPNSPGVYGRLAADPVRSVLQGAAVELAGASIVGTAGLPPTSLSPTGARENAWIVAYQRCRRGCRAYFASLCKAADAGFKCQIETVSGRRGAKTNCRQGVYVSAATGTLERRLVGQRRCSSGSA